LARPNLKSVRLSDEALEIVNSAPGEGFNDKFEKLIFEYKKSIPKRKKILENLEKDIQLNKKHLRELQEKTLEMSKIVTSIKQVDSALENLRNNILNVSQ